MSYIVERSTYIKDDGTFIIIIEHNIWSPELYYERNDSNGGFILYQTFDILSGFHMKVRLH